MSLKVTSYLATLPAAKTPESLVKNTDKNLTLKYFVEGVTAAGDQGHVETEMTWRPSDVAVILGWVHEGSKDSKHLQFRKQILENQTRTGGRTVIADSNLFLYRNTKNPGYWLRYSFDGVFPNTGEYCDGNPDPDRWQEIQQHLGIELRDWRTNGNHILLCLQRDGGWSMGQQNVVDWAMETIAQIRRFSNRPIRIRAHPGDKRAPKYCFRLTKLCAGRNIPGISLSHETATLTQDLGNCWAVVNHNSSPAVAAAIEGIPVFVVDPIRSQAREVANTDLSQLENPQLLDRLAWVQRISQFHWSHQHLIEGVCWQHMRKWAKK